MTVLSAPELRLAGPADAERLLPLVRAYHRFEGVMLSDAQRRAALMPLLEPESPLGRVWLVGLADQPVVGYLALCFGYSIEFAGRDAFVDEFYLVESARGRGIGRSTLARVRDQLASLGVCALHLEVARDNERARRLYMELGFEDRSRFQLMSWRPSG